MIAMWGANSFRTMQKLLGLFSGCYLRGSQNIRMAKQLKPIEGHIAQINAPRFAEDRNMWVMMVKENGKWQAVTSRNEEKIKSYHQLLESKRIAQSINTNIQATSLSASRVRLAEYAYKVLERHSPEEDALLKAAEYFAQKQPILQSPLLSECVEKFLLKQKKRNLSNATCKDYKYILEEAVADHNGLRIQEITPSMWTAFIEKKKHPVTQRSRYIYLKAFLSFCNGKNNPEATERRWLDSIPLCWEAPKTETHEIVSYNFDEVVDVLKEANRNGALGFYVMRLFSMMRSHEYERFIDLGGGDTLDSNRFIDLSNNRITINNFVYRKRGNSENRGRYYNDIHPTFRLWLEYFKANDIKIWSNHKLIKRLTKESTNPKAKAHNILRHTAITFHAIRFSDPLRTAYIAGNSVGIISNHYLNMNIGKTDAELFYDLTPSKAKELGIL
jgi:hypothetical protein